MAVGSLHFIVDHEREEDARWLAGVVALPGVLAYGCTREEAVTKAQILALRVLAEQLEQDEAKPQAIVIEIAAP